jgi:PAS domain S-box-containing protein
MITSKSSTLQVSIILLLLLGMLSLVSGILYTDLTNQLTLLVFKGVAAGICITSAIAFVIPVFRKPCAKPEYSSADYGMLEQMAQEEQEAEQKTNLEQVMIQQTQDFMDTSQRLLQKVEEQQIYQSQIQFQASLLNQVKSAIIATDLQCQITYLNWYAEQLLGWKNHELVGKHILNIISCADKRRIEDEFLKGMEGEQKSFVSTVKVPHKSGEYIHLKISCSPIYDDKNKQLGLVAVAVDMTRHIRQENKLQNEKAKAERLAIARRDFLATMSHEIRTPLNVVIGMTRLLCDNHPRQDQEEYLKSLQFSANHLLTIINDILDMAKIEAGKIKLEQVDFNLKEVLDGVLKAYAVKAKEKGLKLSTDIVEYVPPWLVGDQVRLTQILSNLISNAIKFTKEGFVYVKVRAQRRSNQLYGLHFDIIDSGIGIGQDKLEQIFERFTQAKEDTTRHFGGSGLGLSICKKLVEIQGGEISVRSEEGVGTTFSFSIDYPVSRQEYQVKDAKVNISYPLENVRLLLVDDDEANCIVAKSFLKKLGVTKVTTAMNGEEALKKAQKAPFDIVLMDLQMPIMNGYEATQAIRQLGDIYRHLPIIALTADVVSDVREKVLAAGMNDYLSKPFGPDELSAVIAQHLDITSHSDTQPVQDGDPELVTLRLILEKYQDDEQFTQALLASVHNSYQELYQQVENSVSQWDAISLRRTIHKMHPTLKMMENYKLQENLLLLREYLSGETADKKQLAELTNRIFDLTRRSLEKLEELELKMSVEETTKFM